MNRNKKLTFCLTIAASVMGGSFLDAQEDYKKCFPRLRAEHCEQPAVQQVCPPVEVCPPGQNSFPSIPPMGMPDSPYPSIVAPDSGVPQPQGSTQGDLLPNQLIDPNQFLPGGAPDPSASQSPMQDSVLNQGAAPIAAAQQAAGEDTFAARSNTAGESGNNGMRNMMIGDFFGGASRIAGPSYEKSLPGVRGTSLSSPLMAGDRRYKLTDQLSPLPVDRIFFSYHNFANAVTGINRNQFDVNRYTFGFEKTYLNDNASLELRVPFASGLNFQQREVTPLNEGTQFGNISLTSKFLLRRTPQYSLSAGVASILPSAPDTEIYLWNDNVNPAVIIRNEAIHAVPYMAFNMTPNNRTWMTLASQVDFAVSGNGVESFVGTGQVSDQKYNDQNLMSMDFSAGRWFYQRPRNRILRGVAGIFELHYTTTLNDTDSVQAGPSAGGGPAGDTMSNPFNRLDVLNATAGMRFQVGRKTYATFAFVAPLSEGEERLFDSEISFNLSRGY